MGDYTRKGGEKNMSECKKIVVKVHSKTRSIGDNLLLTVSHCGAGTTSTYDSEAAYSSVFIFDRRTSIGRGFILNGHVEFDRIVQKIKPLVSLPLNRILAGFKSGVPAETR